LHLVGLSGVRGGRCRIRTCDFHRVNPTTLSITTTYKTPVAR
jgi:hypothetical protein